MSDPDIQDVEVPDLSEALLTTLDTIFPERSPSLNESEKERDWRGGQRSVIVWLMEHFNRQNEG